MAEFDAVAESIGTDFERVLASMVNKLGKPKYAGVTSQKKCPPWAKTGLRVAYWKDGGRVIYLHITHLDKEMPLELTMGVVSGPPEGWFIGVGTYEG